MTFWDRDPWPLFKCLRRWPTQRLEIKQTGLFKTCEAALYPSPRKQVMHFFKWFQLLVFWGCRSLPANNHCWRIVWIFCSTPQPAMLCDLHRNPPPKEKVHNTFLSLTSKANKKFKKNLASLLTWPLLGMVSENVSLQNGWLVGDLGDQRGHGLKSPGWQVFGGGIFWMSLGAPGVTPFEQISVPTGWLEFPDGMIENWKWNVRFLKWKTAL